MFFFFFFLSGVPIQRAPFWYTFHRLETRPAILPGFIINAFFLCFSGSWSQYDDIVGTIERKGVASVKYVPTLYIASCLCLWNYVFFLISGKFLIVKLFFIVECLVREVRMEVTQECSVQNMH